MGDEKNKAWICSVCGYIHHGESAPDICPICGVGSKEFSIQAVEAVSKVLEKSEEFLCFVCNYIFPESPLPDICPICGATADSFGPVSPQKSISKKEQKEKILIIGGGIAGVSAAQGIRETSPLSEIALISKEKNLPYYRLNLTRYLANEITKDALPLHPKEWYEENKINLLIDTEVVSFSTKKKEILYLNGKTERYDKLVIATGSHPYVPPFPGVNREGVLTLRTLSDANKIIEGMKTGMPCVCIGGGLLGIETAAALAKRGAKVTLLEGHEWLMPRQLNRTAGELLKEHLIKAGVSLRTCAKTDELMGDERVSAVKLKDGTLLDAGMVIITAGVRPNSYLARKAGMEVNKGIAVNNHLQGSEVDIYAAGDVAEHQGILYGAWSTSQFQGSIAGGNTLGGTIEFGGVPRTNILKVLGLNLMSTGQFEPEDGSFDVVEKVQGDEYFRFIFHDGHFVGAILFGKTAIGPAVKKAIETKEDCTSLLLQKPNIADVIDYFEQKTG